MANNKITIIHCASGRCVAFYEQRDDVITNGDDEKEAKTNLKAMYKIVIEHEKGPGKN